MRATVYCVQWVWQMCALCNILAQLVDYCEKNLNTDKGGLIFDTHLCGALPSDWFDLVIVLRCDNTNLYDRLKERGYDKKKIEENVQAEIFQTILDDAVDIYGKNKVLQLSNSSIKEQESNVDKCQKWITTKQYTLHCCPLAWHLFMVLLVM